MSEAPVPACSGPIAEIEQWLELLHKALETNYARLDKVLAANTEKRRDKR